MASYALRLRRALPFTSTLLNHQNSIHSITPFSSHIQCLSSHTVSPQNPNPNPTFPFNQSRGFRSTPTKFLSSRTSRNFESETVHPNDILFEGCDFHHWLITMDFPKDPRPSDEEMVETYVQTAAAVLGSREEAMKKIYACSTTTYHGFNVEVSEEVSEKFRGLPGVVFILPDSYIDPINKEYGGDKYDNGVITRRPPPVLHTRQGRYGDQNRDYNRTPRGPMQQGPRQNYQNTPPGPMQQGPRQNYQNTPPGPMQQGPPPQQDFQSTPRGPMQQGPPPQQNYQSTPQGPMQQGMPPQQNYQTAPRSPMQQVPQQQLNYPNSPGGQGNYQVDRRDPVPSYQGTYNQGERRDYPPPGQRDFSPRDQRNYAPSGQRDVRGDGGNYAPSPGGNPGQGIDNNYGPRSGENYRQESVSNHWQVGNRPYEQGSSRAPGYDTGSAGYGHGSTGYSENSSFPQVEQRNNVQGQHENQNRSW